MFARNMPSAIELKTIRKYGDLTHHDAIRKTQPIRLSKVVIILLVFLPEYYKVGNENK